MIIFPKKRRKEYCIEGSKNGVWFAFGLITGTYSCRRTIVPAIKAQNKAMENYLPRAWPQAVGLYTISSQSPKSKILTGSASCFNPSCTPLRYASSFLLVAFHNVNSSVSNDLDFTSSLICPWLVSQRFLLFLLDISSQNLLYKGIWTLRALVKQNHVMS